MDVSRRRATRGLVVLCAAALAVLGLALPAQAQSTLRGAAADDYLVGTAVSTDWLNNSTYANIAATEFSSVTAENQMKWDTLQPNPGSFNFGPANQIVNFAQQNGQNVYGHTLVWHSQTPQWVQQLSGNALQQAMQTHITTVMQQFGNNVSQWDVVNEAFEDNGQRRNSFWQQGLGNGYIATALQTARAANPNATLCLNDYNTHNINAKSDAYFNLVQSFIQQGVPIDCVGFQTHLVLGEGLGTMQQNLQRFANLGLDVWVTELDIRITLPASTQQLQQQAQQFAQVYEICQNVAACQGVTVWGVHEEQSWVPDVFQGQGQALIWGNNFQVKPAYAAILQQLGGGTQQQPPPAPAGLTVTNTTQSSVSLSWNASAGATQYQVLRAPGTSGGSFQQVGTTGGTSFTNTGLAANSTFRYQVTASNANGTSPPSSTVTATTQGNGTTSPPPPPPAGCQITYQANNWGGSPGFTANVTITNTGSSTISGWTVGWSYSAGQTISPPGWNATVTPSGSSVTATNAAWNGTISPSQSTSFGFNGTATSIGNNPSPTAFTLNGGSCTLG